MTNDAQSPEAGWYRNQEGNLQWWDGRHWGPLAPEQNSPANSSTVHPSLQQQNPPPEKKGMGCCGWILIVIAILIAFPFIFGSIGGSGSSSSGAAVVACQNVVKDNLRSPSTAKFPSVPKESGGIITGQVDSQNGFGATVRSSFQCTIQGDRVRLDYLR